MVDDEAVDPGAMQSVKVNPADFGSRFSRVPGSADGGGQIESRGSADALKDSTLTGLRAMLAEETQTPAPRTTPKPAVPRRDTPAPRRTVTESSQRRSLVEVGDVLQNAAFQFTLQVQEVKEDGSVIGRAPGVGRVRVRPTEMGQYTRIGKAV